MNEITLSLTAMAHGGAALGRHEGRVIFVPYALPGESVTVTLGRSKKQYAFAHLLRLEAAAPERVAPPCPYFDPQGCGGCQWQHASYPAQLAFKSEIVANQLTRLGGIASPPVRSTLPAESGWAYRNHAQFHPVSGNGPVSGVGLGFQAAGGQVIIPVDHCLLLHPLLAELYDSLKLWPQPGLHRLSLRVGAATGERMIILEMDGDQPPTHLPDLAASCVLLPAEDEPVALSGQTYLTEKVNGRAYTISAPSFFRVNSSQAGQLVRLVLEYLALQGEETVLDAYCGVGLFTVPVAERAKAVLAVELAPTALADLRANTADFKNVKILSGLVETVLPHLETPFEAAIVDPPRAGLARTALEALIQHRPARLVYVSCDPATLARDARLLTEAGYRLVEVQPVDMFPQTYHIETVALFVSP